MKVTFSVPIAALTIAALSMPVGCFVPAEPTLLRWRRGVAAQRAAAAPTAQTMASDFVDPFPERNPNFGDPFNSYWGAIAFEKQYGKPPQMAEVRQG
jgi:hypothetical protein